MNAGTSMNLQRTLKSEVSQIGVGIHSGRLTRMTLKPAPPNHGVVFVRTDIEGHPEILAHFDHVISTQLATTLGNGKAIISTVEHVLAALHCAGVDNVRIEVDGPEVPIMDGSSGPFYESILAAGVESQLQTRAFLLLKKKVELKLGEKWAVAEPASHLEIRGSIEWDHPSIGYQEFHYREGLTANEDLLWARTFGFVWDVDGLKKKGLAQGASLDNAVALDHALVLNPGGLRCPDEFVKHKVLDALGDFKLAGVQVKAHFRLHRAGHDLHYLLLKEIFKDASNYEMIEQIDRSDVVLEPCHALVEAGCDEGYDEYAVG